MRVEVTDHIHDDHWRMTGSEEEILEAVKQHYPFIVTNGPADGNLHDVLEYLDGQMNYSVRLEDDPIIKSEADSNLSTEEEEQNIAIAMIGYQPFLHSAFEAARFLAGGKQLTLDQLRRALWEQDNDIEAAALYAYGFEITEDTRRALRGAMGLSSLNKSEQQVPKPHSIVAVHPEGSDTAEQLARAFKQGQVDEVKLKGKHSAGSMVATDPKTNTVWLLKPGSGPQSPAAGAREEPASQSRREVAFYKVSEALGLEDFIPYSDLINIDGKEIAAMKLLPFNYKDMDKIKQVNASKVLRVLEQYLYDGALHKWAVMDFILGNTDRHGQNMLMNEDGDVALIDHGSAFAGEHFDPAFDRNSFIPYYLRAWYSGNFNQLETKEKLKNMPRLSEQAEHDLRQWIDAIDEKELERVMNEYGIDPQPSLERLAKLKMMEGPKDYVICQLWAGT